ncbi:DNA-deoxyinosine glycosylase [Sedimentisphaera cyanobacteriorum]|uniref:DNA-deoxyinosine glycosylase n=1 Tax=Sedimentisphaera cyanobacteriorum TaxID=1940790 RepID=A0A1Q2HP28_9BACT|nr:DNA-deoxyinosine glycosylase [Sedimentisphaera cyanobacteriorum]AQQ09081.1 DNA-deoxyinosine glycosylase [Sedimentisphaera cyanobacteriorum]
MNSCSKNPCPHIDQGILQSFDFSADRRSRILILGSMPGGESLKQRQYYAHHKNLFWHFMGIFFAAGWQLPYPKRLEKLRDSGVALWDAAQSCLREGSLDSNIKEAQPNDFSSLIETAPNIHTVFFNGRKAAELFRKLAAPEFPQIQRIEQITLPSTSPANASIPYDNKLSAWREVLKAAEKF